LFNIDIRLIQGFVHIMRKSGMATVTFSFVGGGRLVCGGRRQAGEVQLPMKIEI
jgi:hypothetical protein